MRVQKPERREEGDRCTRGQGGRHRPDQPTPTPAKRRKLTERSKDARPNSLFSSSRSKPEGKTCRAVNRLCVFRYINRKYRFSAQTTYRPSRDPACGRILVLNPFSFDKCVWIQTQSCKSGRCFASVVFPEKKHRPDFPIS